ncbi:GNAT family N-acetyltransferase [Thalassobacillus pellis]|uniref:GNAT family N-acetyltransferase n=1 Tax=Thalassobacillus pellis TaxID=748008 RepID=UPI00196165F9|nr:GNAT family N-acetyltransferase [Thalassobacillus pellis]MBM7553742.1 putative N-acetyltransferase YhbS [Thalassobacillus pellis]
MKNLLIREYMEKDFPDIQELNRQECWTGLVDNWERTKKAWESSQITLIAEAEGLLTGYVRGLTDGHVTLYICEILVGKPWRGRQVGQELLSEAHKRFSTTRIEMLATSSSASYYKGLNYRPFYGFRKSLEKYTRSRRANFERLKKGVNYF